MTYTIKEYNCETGETLEREMTASEIDALDVAAALDKKTEETKTKIEAEKVAAKQSAQAKLAALGLTADEIAALGN